MSDRPVIGVAWPRRDYEAALDRAGAEIRELKPERDRLPDALGGCDGLLLTGGPDVDPREYGESDRHPTVEVNPARDEYELALARYALDRDVPVLAICRGAQVLNVAAGGNLIQDLPTAQPSAVGHSVKQPTTAEVHELSIAPDTCLAVLMESRLRHDDPIIVNSRHHQSIRDVAAGFVVSATAPDGVVEAIERPGAAFCLGVQWHPENYWRTGEFSTLFDGLIGAAARYRRSRTTP
jgi:putative glutamine amidotransferase